MAIAVSTDGLGINYERVGEGPPLLLLHGFAMGLERWKGAGYVDDLRADFSVIITDARGHGRSGKPHESSAYSLDLMVDDALAVLSAQGIDRAHLWGYSMGGTVIRRLCERVPALPLSVVIGGSAPSDMVEVVRDDPQEVALRKGIQAYVDLMDPNGNVLTEQARTFFLSNDADALAALRAATLRWRVTAPRIACPALIYAGEKDAVHERAESYVADLPDARFRTVPDANHGMAFGVSAPVLPWVRDFLGDISV
jgi:pimeloyl-ACP methyl ester carboxylesterase